MLEKLESNSERYSRKIPTVGGEPYPGILLEMVYRPQAEETGFVVWNGSKLSYEPQFALGDNRILVPYSPANNLIAHNVVLLPSQAEEYGSEEQLVSEIQSFIHRYVDVSPLFERISTYYVLLTWIYDNFNELPYLRLRGDPGSGKTRFLLIIGSICYRPIFASGASTVSPLFRILDSFRGTLVIDEGDFRLSDEKAEIVKILNNGNARGFPVLRSEVSGNRKEFNPTAFHVFGPKLVATRGFFEDRALESRFITEEMGQFRLREDIPINLPETYKDEALQIRNKLLMFRFRNRRKRHVVESLVDRMIEPRLNQIFVPLLSVIQEPEARRELQDLARRYNRENIVDRGMGTEAQILEIIKDLGSSSYGTRLSIKEITSRFVERFGDDYERKITTKWIGGIVRKKLNLHPIKSHGVFVIPESEAAKLERLFERYGIVPGEGGQDPGQSEAVG